MAPWRPTIELLHKSMENTDYVRNVCILAHVDHGKTTVADCLLTTNSLVSKHMAGELRYLDDRPDEQDRGITMKSSAISLFNKIIDEETHEENQLLVNLIDTPGHIDFSSEVGAALRVCDGALIVVDLVEGVCVQTKEAIKQAFNEHCKMILLLNKIDRLIVDLHKELDDVFRSILHVIEDCNVVIAELYSYQYCDSKIDIEDSGLLFTPETGNVIFASAIDGWGFTLNKFAKMFINDIQNETVGSLNMKLWNFDAYVSAKTKQIELGAIEKGKTNLFTQLCLKTIYQIYNTIVAKKEHEKVSMIVDKLKICNTREMNHKNPKTQLKGVMQGWSHLADTILHQFMKIIPSPSKLSEEKIKYLLDYNKFCEDESHKNSLDQLIPMFKDLNSDGEIPSIVYVSKMFCVDNKNLSQNKPRAFVPQPRIRNKDNQSTNVSVPMNGKTNNQATETTSNVSNAKEENNKSLLQQTAIVQNQIDYSIIALARVFTGTLKSGQEIYVLFENHAPGDSRNVKKVKVKELYMLFGKDLVLVDIITAGNICGIGGLDDSVERTATLSTSLECVPFIQYESPPPIVRNIIEPEKLVDYNSLQPILKILERSDPCVQTYLGPDGEYVLLTAGDVHLAKCIRDLETKFFKGKISVSKPIVSLKETVAVNNSRKYLENSLSIEVPQFRISVVVINIPDSIVNEVEKNYRLLGIIEEHKKVSGFEVANKHKSEPDKLRTPTLKVFKSEATNASLKNIRQRLIETFEHCEGIWPQLKDKIWSVDKRSHAVNLLINATKDYSRTIFETLDETDLRSCFDQLIINAFVKSCDEGPICGEPLKSCAFFIKKFEILPTEMTDWSIPTCLSIESTLTSGFKEAFEKQPQRLMEPFFTTTIRVNVNILGKVYAVVQKRRGHIIQSIEMDEEKKVFFIEAQIPATKCDGFADEIRTATSGQAMPSLKFSHFEVLDSDPYYDPLENEDDDLDINSVRATELRREVRRRKGMFVDEQLVIHGEKQRTLSKKK